MSIYRSYLKKNNTLISDNQTNNSQNPVTEVSYGTIVPQISRFIFELDLEPLQQRIEEGIINPDRISKHILHLTNTIRFNPDLIGKKTYDSVTQRASSFQLDLFNLTEEWDEGSGYEFIYNENEILTIPFGASNWFERKTDIDWSIPGGSYESATTLIFGTQSFEIGNEDFVMDITDYVNMRLGLLTGTTATTGITASTGMGIKFTDKYEALETTYRQAVAFFARKTNTFYAPYIETIYDDLILDDRNYFYLDKDNELYLYANVGSVPENVNVTGVTIIDYMGKEITDITGDSIQNIGLGIYKIIVNIDSSSYPDAVLFTDRWKLFQNGKYKEIDQEFYLINSGNYYNFTLDRINFDNYTFNYYGIKEGEKIKDNNIRRIEIEVKHLYPNQNNNLPFDVEYKLYNTQSATHQFEVIPWTKANRTFRGYEILLDFSWLIPQDYKLEFRLMNNNTFQVKDPIKFSVVSQAISRP